jgi:two-component system chemotaxis sensor kinase CheA
VFLNGTKPHSLISELAEMGEVSIIPFYSSIPSLKEIDPTKCYMSWDIILTTTKSVNDIQDVFMFLDNSSKVEVKKVADSNQDSHAPKRLGEILIEKNLVTQDEITAAIGVQKPLGQILTEKKVVSVEDEVASVEEDSHSEDCVLAVVSFVESFPLQAVRSATQRTHDKHNKSKFLSVSLIF